MKKIVFTGGGTAGHVTPNLALVPFIHGAEIHYIGSNGIEKTLAKKAGLIFHEIPCVKLVRAFTLKNLKIPFLLAGSVNAAKKILREIKPDVIFSKGGFVGLPVALAADNQTPLFLHESDMSMGLANRIAYRKCDVLFTSFDCIKKKKAVFSGAPLRREIYCGDKNKALKQSRLTDNGKKFLLVFGGSLGARSINKAVDDNLCALTEKYNVIHIRGKGNKLGITKTGYFEIEFTENIYDFFALSDIVVSRGGANSLFELMALKKPTLCIPLSKEISRGDQIDNASYFQKRGCLNILNDNGLLKDHLLGAIAETACNAEVYRKNIGLLSGIDGTKTIARAINEAVGSAPAQITDRPTH